MCGICGIVSRESKTEFEIIKKMNDAIAHRGPDDEGYLSYNPLSRKIRETRSSELSSVSMNENDYSLYFGHRRLSVIDTSESGHQPFKDPSGKYYLLYNGEVYNYIELKKTISGNDYKFTSHTDTEIVLYNYIRYGEKCLEKFNGMWSFVILDVEKNLLFGSRDRSGVKPFYYYFDGKHFIFSSEIKSLIKAPQISKKINPVSAFDYLTLGRLNEEDKTLFDSVYELEPASYFYLNLNNFSFTKNKYYSLKYSESREKFDGKKSHQYVEEVRNKVIDSVNLRLRSDVKVGSCLSGGVDSSAIVCVINKLLKSHKIEQVGEVQKVFTSVFPDTPIDESKWASQIVSSTDTEWFKTFPKPDELLGDLEKLVYVQDVPFGSTTIYSQFRVMKLAAENGVKVLLDGQGGDELFSGYTYFYRSYFNELIKNANYGTLINEFQNLKNSPIRSGDFFRGILMSFAKLYLPNAVKRKLFDLKVNENTFLNRDFYNAHYGNLEKGRFAEHTDLNFALYEQFTRTSLRELLKYEDRNSMNFSIEARTPFSDDVNLIDYVFSIPSSYKIRNGWSKYLLRESMKGIVPEAVRTRTDKLGFATPEYRWMNDIKDHLKVYFTPDLDEYFDTKKILNDWDSVFQNQSKKGFTTIWRFVNFAIWKKVYGM